MKCEDIHEVIERHKKDLVTPSEMVAARKHVSQCEICKVLLRKRIEAAMKRLTPERIIASLAAAADDVARLAERQATDPELR